MVLGIGLLEVLVWVVGVYGVLVCMVCGTVWVVGLLVLECASNQFLVGGLWGVAGNRRAGQSA